MGDPAPPRTHPENWKLNVVFDPNLAQLGGQLGLNLGPKRHPKRVKRDAENGILLETSKIHPNDPNLTPKSTQHDPQMKQK